MDQEKLVPIVMAALLAIGGARLMSGDQAKPEPAAGTAVVVGVPSAELQALVAPLRELAAKDRDAAIIGAAFYRATADIVRRDTKRIKTVGQFVSVRVEANKLYLEKSPKAGTLHIGPTVDEVFAKYVELDDVAIDDAKRTKIVDACEAIAWALEGGK